MVGAVDVTNVLRALEYSEGKTGQKVAGGEKSGSWTQRESRVLLEEVANFLELGYTVQLEDLFVSQLFEGLLILLASMLRYEILQGVKDALPGLVFGLGVGDIGYRIAVFVGECNLGDEFPDDKRVKRLED